MRTILHVDLNNFYASVECLHRPEYRNLPLAVCGDIELRHGIVLAKNQLAKGKGVTTGEAIWKAKQKCSNLVTVLPNFSLYFRYSQMARRIYEDYTDLIEPFGIDECWLDVTNSLFLFSSGEEIANTIRSRLENELGITASVGVSFNKIFAKLGSDYKKPNATTVISPKTYKEFVKNISVGDLLYVGKATKRKLETLGVFTIGDLADYSCELLVSKLGKWGKYLYTFANGLDNSPVRHKSVYSAIKSVGNSITTVRDMKSIKDIEIIINLLSDSVASRLREKGLKGSVVSLYVKNSELFGISRQLTLKFNTFLASEIAVSAMDLFVRNIHFPFKIRNIGVQVSKLIEENSDSRQIDFFGDAVKEQKLVKLDKTIDKIRKRFGYKSIKKGILFVDESLTEVQNPKEDNIIHPVCFFG